MTELSALVSPGAFLVTRGEGSHEITRVYWTERTGKIQVGPERERLGGQTVVRVDYYPERGLFLETDGGAHLYIPADRIQATWRLG